MIEGEVEQVRIRTEFIRLDAFLKFASLSGTGGMAKAMIQGGAVSVNGEGCTQRGRKLRPGDVVRLTGGDGKAYRVV